MQEAQQRQVQSLGSGRSPGVGNGNPFQDSCQENPMDRRDCQATGHSVAKSRNNLATKQQIIRNNTDTKKCVTSQDKPRC